MARPRGLIQRGRLSSTKRPVSWGVGPGGTAVNTITGSVSLILGSQLVLTRSLQSTLMRIRGQCDVVLQLATALGDGFQGAMGIGIVTTAAADVGITALPAPIDEAEWDGWIFHHFVSVHRGAAASADGAAHQRIVVDSKAMRKWDESMTMVAVIQLVEIGTADVDVFFDSRVLLKQ